MPFVHVYTVYELTFLLLRNCPCLFQSVQAASSVMIWLEEGVCTSGVPSALTSSVVGVAVPLKRARSVTMVTKHAPLFSRFFFIIIIVLHFIKFCG